MPSSEIQTLARQLLAFEEAHLNASKAGGASDGAVAVRVIEELRLRLIKLAGAEGFRSLLSRSLTLARAEAPCLNQVHVGANGTLEGFGDIEDNQTAGQAGSVLVAHLLALLMTFIGESLTLRLVRESWPAASMSEVDLWTEEKP